MTRDTTQRLGPKVRSDIVDVYVFRQSVASSSTQSIPSQTIPTHSVEFLQMRRAQGALIGSWHQVMGHIEPGETAPQTAIRELSEETGYTFNPQASVGETTGTSMHALGFWQLELVNTYYLASHESIVMSPGFAVEVPAGSDPVLDESHDAFRWIGDDQIDRFLWPGQREALQHIIRDIATPDAESEIRQRLKLDPSNLPGQT